MDENPSVEPLTLDEQAQRTVYQLLADAPAAQEVWSATLDVLEGFVAQAVNRGWHPAHARAMVAHRFCGG